MEYMYKGGDRSKREREKKAPNEMRERKCEETRGLMIICLGFVSYFLFMPLFPRHSLAIVYSVRRGYMQNSFRSELERERKNEKKTWSYWTLLNFDDICLYGLRCTWQPNIRNRLQLRANWTEVGTFSHSVALPLRLSLNVPNTKACGNKCII